MENREKIIEVKDLVISFKTDHGILKAVRNISFDLYKGETLCIVGESGSGKSVTSKAIMAFLLQTRLLKVETSYIVVKTYSKSQKKNSTRFVVIRLV